VDALSPTTIQNLIQVYGLWVLFPVVMLEGMGIPVPGETALVTTAVYTGSTGRISIVPVVLAAGRCACFGRCRYFIFSTP
jgi:membrane protein DedA with SNARE-associated domain